LATDPNGAQSYGKEDVMDWIERLFNVSPDNGDGTLEAVLITIAVIIAALVVASMRPVGRRVLDRVGRALMSTVKTGVRRTTGHR
jgi:hypothetical protein